MADLVGPGNVRLVGTERCGNCVYKRMAPGAAARKNPPSMCHRFPPKMTTYIVGGKAGKDGTEYQFHHSIGHPIIAEDDWCGEWRGVGTKPAEQMLLSEVKILNDKVQAFSAEIKELMEPKE